MYLLCAAVFLLLCSACHEAVPDFAQPALSDEVTEQAFIWNGFHTAWGYNHRINRLGSYLGSADCSGLVCQTNLVHTAASGSGSDKADLQDFFTFVSAPGVRFLQGYTSFVIDEERGEGKTLTYVDEVSLSLEEHGLNEDALHVVLGGFDLASMGDADKLQMLDIHLSEATIDRDAGTVNFDVSISLKLDCDSPECDLFDKGVQYQADIVWTLIAGDAADLNVTSVDIAGDYTWDDGRRSPELERSDVRQRHQLQLTPGPSQMVPAFRGFRVELDSAHHMTDWVSVVRAVDHDPHSGAASIDVELMFKQWNQGTRDFVLSYVSSGDATVSAEVSVIQIDGCTRTGKASSALYWEADGGAATDNASRHESLVEARCMSPQTANALWVRGQEQAISFDESPPSDG